MVEILIINMNSFNLYNLTMFKVSLRPMIPNLQIYDKIHYGKCLPEFWTEISTLSEKMPLQIQKIFSQSITVKAHSSSPMDLWIEMTIKNGSKMKG